MKEKRFEAVDFYYNFFEKKCKKGIQKVPLSKLKGLDTAWNIVGRSVYDCFTSIASDSPWSFNIIFMKAILRRVCELDFLALSIFIIES